MRKREKTWRRGNSFANRRRNYRCSNVSQRKRSERTADPSQKSEVKAQHLQIDHIDRKRKS